jgi:hypothetical protein
MPPPILDLCDSIREFFRDGRRSTPEYVRHLAILQDALAELPANTAPPDEALRIRAFLQVSLVVNDAYGEWVSGGQTPLKRMDLERALCAAEAIYNDGVIPAPVFYGRICGFLDRPDTASRR